MRAENWGEGRYQKAKEEGEGYRSGCKGWGCTKEEQKQEGLLQWGEGSGLPWRNGHRD